MRDLSTSERIDLELKLKKTKDLSEWKRIFAILGFDAGQSVEELSKTLRLSPFTIEDYLKEYNSNDKTKNDPRGGGSSKLSKEETTALEDHLSKTTYLKVKDIVSYVKAEFNKEYSRTGMTAWLKDRGFTFKRPEKVPGKIDPVRQAVFIEEYKKLKSSLNPEDRLYFIDAVHPEYQSQAVCGWIKKGERKTLQTTGKQKRLHFVGALTLNGMDTMIREYETIDADAMIHFFKELEEESKAVNIHIILDNARAHRNHKLDAYLKTSKIRLHYLPPYSPNLNPIERLWKVFRETTLYNRFFPTCWDFFAAVRAFFADKIYKMKRFLTQRISDNFQMIQLNPIHLA
jgi:transposase